MERTSNHYLTLRLPQDATSEEIQHAYKEAARRFHPDVNPDPGSNDLFIRIQEAYQTLSNPQQRAKYDEILGLDRQPKHLIKLNELYSRSTIPVLEGMQLFYVLLEIVPILPSDKRNNIPLNLALVLDRSTSMQGVKLDMVKANANRLLRQLKPEDVISVIAFSDQAEVLIPATRSPDISRTEVKISQLAPGGSTELFNGLECGLKEIGRYLNPNSINHLILLTDGHTYGDEDACFRLAEEAANQGIGISGLGLGDRWNDEFLDKLANISGGCSMYVEAPKDLHEYMEEKFSNLVKVFAENLTLEYECDERVEIQNAFRLEPEPGRLLLEHPIRIGRVLSNKPGNIIFEFLIKGPLEVGKEVSLAKGNLKMDIPSQTIPVERLFFNFKRPVGEIVNIEPANPAILQAMSRLSLYNMQEKARQEVLNGDIAKATKHLQNLATHLLSKGEKELAHTVLVEAEKIQRSNKYSNDGDKRIKYGTRKLLLLSGMENENV